jgi:hypothetical protein
VAVRIFDDFTGEEILEERGNGLRQQGWVLQRTLGGPAFHSQSLSQLFRALALEGVRFGMEDDKEIPRTAGLRVSRVPARKNGKAV